MGLSILIVSSSAGVARVAETGEAYGGERHESLKSNALRHRLKKRSAILIMTAAIGIQIGIGTEIDEKARNSTPIAIAISISTVRMCHN
jgi:hypothetical protein